MGTACGQHISHIPWNRYNRECTLHCNFAPVALEDFRLLLMQLCYLKMNMHLVSACLAFLPAQSPGRLVLQELGLVQLKQLFQQLNQKSPLITCDQCPMPAQRCAYTSLAHQCLPFLEAVPPLLSQAHSSSASLHLSLTLPRD